MHDKVLTCTAGKPGDRHRAQVEFTGELDAKMAVDAAKRAFGHANGVTVTDGAVTYRCTNDKARKVK